jgi:SNF2 family DNA or RNA helicase
MVLHKKGFAKKMLIVAPLRVALKTWPDEIKKWAHTEHLTYTVLHGPDKADRLDGDYDIYIINYEGLQWLFDPLTIRPKFDVLCCDESSKLKDSSTKRFKILKNLLPTFKYRWILTGTPVPNGLMDLFGQIYILDQGAALGRYVTHFRQRFFTQPNPMNPYVWVPRDTAFNEVVQKVKPFVLQLSAEDYLLMPDLIYKDVFVDLPESARRVYDKVEEEFVALMDDSAIVAANAAVAGGKCRQIANGAVYVDLNRNWKKIHDEKLDALEDLLEELGGAPTLILYEFQHDLERLLARLGKVPVLGGGISESKLSRLIDDFNAGRIPVLFGHPASMGHGLNLQGSCAHVIWFGITWNLEYYDQAIARIYRQGQKARSVFVYHIVARDTIDERVVKVLNAKDKTQQSLLAALADKAQA